MTTKTKLALAALMLGIGSTAQAGGSRNDADVSGGTVLSATNCPALEGYPDCHPDVGAAGAFGMDYSTHSRHLGRSQYQRRR